jgi:hypothetical protein
MLKPPPEGGGFNPTPTETIKQKKGEHSFAPSFFCPKNTQCKF